MKMNPEVEKWRMKSGPYASATGYPCVDVDDA